MIHNKHSFHATVLAAILCGAPFISLHAQNPDGGQARPPHDRPPSPLFDALDTNHDDVISAEEIANATGALKALLKNGATQITRDDVRPPHPLREHDDQSEARPHPGAESFRPHAPGPDGMDRPDAGDERPHPSRDDAAGPRHRPHGPPSPLFDPLDTNHDGVISSDEMANAAESLKKLDRTGSRQIKREDLKRLPPPVNND